MKGNFSVLIVNDGSNENLKKDFKFKNIKFIEVLNMEQIRSYTQQYYIKFLSKKQL